MLHNACIRIWLRALFSFRLGALTFHALFVQAYKREFTGSGLSNTDTCVALLLQADTQATTAMHRVLSAQMASHFEETLFCRTACILFSLRGPTLATTGSQHGKNDVRLVLKFRYLLVSAPFPQALPAVPLR